MLISIITPFIKVGTNDIGFKSNIAIHLYQSVSAIATLVIVRSEWYRALANNVEMNVYMRNFSSFVFSTHPVVV